MYEITYLALIVTAASMLLWRFKPRGSFGFGGGGGSETTVAKSEPPAFVIPFSKQLLERASNLSQTFPNVPFPSGSEQVVGFSPFEQTAFGLTAARALQGAPEVNAARSGLLQFLGNQPGFDPVTNALVERSQSNLIDQFNQQVVPGRAAQFQQAGTFGGTAQQELEASDRFSLAKALSDAETGIRDVGLSRALQAVQLAPQLASEDFRNIAALQGAGQQQRGLAQLIRDLDVAGLSQTRQVPITRLSILGDAITRAGGGFSTQTQTTSGGSNPFISALGGLGSLFGGIGALAPIFNS